jgi:Na+-transporting methylmalonyl-CoA/oxaloacetate decarboxylase beta subunit
LVIRALDHVAHCYGTADGVIVARVLRQALARDGSVVLSLAGVTDIPSSFVNASIVALLNDYPAHVLKKRLRIIDASPQAADMIRRCMSSATHLSQAA